MATKLNMTLLLRRGEFSDSYVLQAGEPGYHTGTKVLKIGDGTTTWGELKFANQAQIEELIKVVDDKVAALGETYATDEEVRLIKEALEASIKTITDELDTYGDIVTHNASEFEVAGAAADVAGDLADYETANDARVKAIEDEIDTFGDIVTHNVAEFATAAQGAKADAAAVKTEVEGALALKADKSVVDAMYTNAQIDELVQGAKDYAAGLDDADTKYGIAYDSDTKKITLVEGGTNFEIDATDFIKDGMIESVALSEDGLNLVITWNTDADKGENNVTTIPLTGLVDIYTGVAGDRVTVTVSSDDKISADLVAGSITKNYLDTAVQTSLGLADSALQAADLADYAKTADVVTNDEFTTFEAANTEAIGKKLDTTTFEAFNNGTSKTVAAIEADIVSKANAAQAAAETTAAADATAKANKALEDAKAYADGKEHKNTTYAVAATANALEFTVTPNEGEAQTITLVAPDTGVMSVAAGASNEVITVSTVDGAVTVSHKDYETGTVKDAAHDSATDPSFITGISIENGHVTGATVRNLAEVLTAMEFILDCGAAE